jgi:hypothetical protein
MCLRKYSETECVSVRKYSETDCVSVRKYSETKCVSENIVRQNVSQKI